MKKKIKILYIEDDRDTQLLVSRILPTDRFDLYFAEKALDGYTLFEKVEPDIVLMDLDLPDLGGLELSTKIRGRSGELSPVIIAVTGKVEFSNKEKTIIAGCDGYIPKPFDIDFFMDQIIEIFEGKKLEISPEKRQHAIQEFQIELVNKLEEKVKALQDVNEKLTLSNQLLKKKEKAVSRYNEQLVHMHEVANALHRMKSLDEFKQTLPRLITDKLGFDRCILFEFNMEKNKINPVSWSGLKQDDIKDFNLVFDISNIEHWSSDKLPGIIKVTNLTAQSLSSHIPYVNDLKRNLKSKDFLMGYIGPQHGKHLINQSSNSELNHTLQKFLKNIYEKMDPETLQDELEKYLTTNLYQFSGLIYVDNAMKGEEPSDFDNKILATLIEDAKTVYENISLIQILQKLYFKAGQDAITDPLTGIFNYRYFINQLIRELNRAQRYRIPLSLAMIDIDFFKIYNDSFGHLAGDYVLRKLAQLLKENTRISDVVARYGGEEFVIILPEATKQEAFKLAEKIRQIISNFEFLNQEKMPDQNLTISIGVAAYPEDGHLPEVLIEHADIALYRAKNSGKNKVCLYKQNGE